MATQREMYHGNVLYAWRESAANRTRAIDVDKWAQNQADILHLPGAQGEKKLSILDNAISPSSAFIRVDTEGGAPADDLAAITPGDLHAGMLLHLVAADSERVVTLRNSADATGIQTVDGKDVALDTQYGIVLRLVSTEALTYWEEIPGPLRAKKQPVASKDNLGLMQVGQRLTVTPEGIVDAPLASESEQGIGRSATAAEVESGVTGNPGPAWVTPEHIKPLKEEIGSKLDSDLRTDIPNATDTENVITPAGAYRTNREMGKLQIIGSATQIGTWTITNVITDIPLYIEFEPSTSTAGATAKIINGILNKGNPEQGWAWGQVSGVGRPMVNIFHPNAEIVEFNIYNMTAGSILRAWQTGKLGES